MRQKTLSENDTLYKWVRHWLEYTNTVKINGASLYLSSSNGKITTWNTEINSLLEQKYITAYKNPFSDNKYYYTGINGERLNDYEWLSPAAFIKKFMEINNILLEVVEKIWLGLSGK